MSTSLIMLHECQPKKRHVSKTHDLTTKSNHVMYAIRSTKITNNAGGFRWDNEIGTRVNITALCPRSKLGSLVIKFCN